MPMTGHLMSHARLVINEAHLTRLYESDGRRVIALLGLEPGGPRHRPVVHVVPSNCTIYIWPILSC